MASKRTAAAEVIRLLRALRSVRDDDRERRTAILRDLGEATVDFRTHFLTADGEPDWAGRTGAYRTAISDLYNAADYSVEEAQATLKAARYHIAITLRDQLSREDIEAIGLRAEGPRARQVEFRERRAALVAAAGALMPENAPETPEERVAVLRGALAAIQLIKPLTPHEKARADYAEHYRAAHKLAEQIVAGARHVTRMWPPPPGEDYTIA